MIAFLEASIISIVCLQNGMTAHRRAILPGELFTQPFFQFRFYFIQYLVLCIKHLIDSNNLRLFLSIFCNIIPEKNDKNASIIIKEQINKSLGFNTNIITEIIVSTIDINPKNFSGL